MKIKTGKIKLVTMLVLLIIAIISVTNVTYSFFSSTSSTGGEVVFGQMNFSMFYEHGSANREYINQQYNVVPDGPIARGKSFSIYVNDDGNLLQTTKIGFANRGNVACYVRFWIDVFVEGDESQTNYGKYFYIERPSNVYVRKKVSADSEPACYYLAPALNSYSENFCYQNDPNVAAKSLFKMQDIPHSDLDSAYKTEDDALPLSILGKKLTITISFESVQKANEAWKTEFNDELGYYEKWV